MQFLASIIVVASMYALIGAGFITIYRASRVLNFAYPDIALVIGYFMVTLAAFLPGHTILAIAISLFFSFAFGLLIYRLLIKAMIGESLLATIILTVALGIVLNAIAVGIWRGKIEILNLGWRAYYTLPGKIRISSIEIITVIVTPIVFLILSAFYKFSKVGRQMRATAENLLLAAQRGININFITGSAWGIGILVTGVATILFGGNYGVSLLMGNMVIKGFAVALVAGLDSIKGAIPAALIIALVERLAAYYINPRLGETIPFIIMLIVLLIRPWGLWGTKEEIERV